MEKNTLEMAEKITDPNDQMPFSTSDVVDKYAQRSKKPQVLLCCCLSFLTLVALLALCAGVAAIVLFVVFPNITNGLTAEIQTLKMQLETQSADQNITNGEIKTLKMQLEMQNAQLDTLASATQAPPPEFSATYTRWGNSSCPDVPGTELVYTGIVGGSGATVTGGGANYLCMPMEPEYTLPNQDPSIGGMSMLYTTQYGQPIGGTHVADPPCAVCNVATRSTVLMIPAKTTCPQDWTEEYEGYIMAAGDTFAGRTTLTCVDKGLEILSGSEGDVHPFSAHFWHVEGSCNAFSCPPYTVDMELNCVVCSK